jgi:hypothetical protein
LKLAAIVEMGSKDETDGWIGRTVAYIRSKRYVSKISRTTSMVLRIGQADLRLAPGVE